LFGDNAVLIIVEAGYAVIVFQCADAATNKAIHTIGPAECYRATLAFSVAVGNATAVVTGRNATIFTTAVIVRVAFETIQVQCPVAFTQIEYCIGTVTTVDTAAFSTDFSTDAIAGLFMNAAINDVNYTTNRTTAIQQGCRAIDDLNLFRRTGFAHRAVVGAHRRGITGITAVLQDFYPTAAHATNNRSAYTRAKLRVGNARSALQQGTQRGSAVVVDSIFIQHGDWLGNIVNRTLASAADH